MLGGLEVLNKNGIYIPATPMYGTFVVNVGDFLQRISNDVFVSTVHRVRNLTGLERYSIPFFFSFNMDVEVPVCISSSDIRRTKYYTKVLKVLPSCISEVNPAKYQPRNLNEVSHSLWDTKTCLLMTLCTVYGNPPEKPENKARAGSKEWYLGSYSLKPARGEWPTGIGLRHGCRCYGFMHISCYTYTISFTSVIVSRRVRIPSACSQHLGIRLPFNHLFFVRDWWSVNHHPSTLRCK